MRLERELGIITILLQNGGTNARELARQFEVSTRTIYRDVEALSMAGIPVYATRGAKGGIYLAENYTLSRLLICDREKESLALALQTLGAIRHPGTDDTLSKLYALFGDIPTDWVSVDFAPWGSSSREQAHFPIIRDAILNCRLLTFDYLDANGRKSSRVVEPMRLLFVGYTWYLQAYCHQRDALRTFKVTRMRGVEATNGGFVRRNLAELLQKSELETASNDRSSQINCQLKFSPATAYRVYDLFSEQQVTRLSDGSLLVSVCWPEDEWLYGTILSFGGDVEVLAPLRLRAVVHRRLKLALRLYQAEDSLLSK